MFRVFFFLSWIKCVFQLEQMDLEVREIPIQSRAMYNSRLKSYKQEVEKLEKDFVSTHTPPSLLSGCYLEILPVTCLIKLSFKLQMPIFLTAEYCNCMWGCGCLQSPSQTLCASNSLPPPPRQTQRRSRAECVLEAQPCIHWGTLTLSVHRGCSAESLYLHLQKPVESRLCAFVSAEPGLV